QYDGGASVDDETLDESVGMLGFLTFVAGVFGSRKLWHAPLAGAAAGALTWFMYAGTGLSPWGFICLGALGAVLLAWFGSALQGAGGVYVGGGGFSSGSGFSGRGGGFGGGGFRGGGGSFGGGGASGRW
ncbi:MAG: hypothetical protein IKH84_04050, partial [Ottowia sp.]|nr:hypothetical protein [Ottowia sp.]